MTNDELRYSDYTSIFKSRYEALKAKKLSIWLDSNDIVIKVCGGYIVISPSNYKIWKNQK